MNLSYLQIAVLIVIGLLIVSAITFVGETVTVIVLIVAAIFTLLHGGPIVAKHGTTRS